MKKIRNKIKEDIYYSLISILSILAAINCYLTYKDSTPELLPLIYLCILIANLLALYLSITSYFNIEDKLVGLYAYNCPKCGAEFYTLKENVKYCPRCGATPVLDKDRTRRVSLYNP